MPKLATETDKLATATVPGTPAPRSRMTISEMTEKVIRDNPDIGMSGAREREQLTSVALAKAARLPTVEGSASTGPQRIYDPSTGSMIRKEASVELNQKIFDFGAISNDIRRAESTYESATSNRLSKAEEVAFDMMTSYLKVKQAEEMISVVEHNIAAHQKILDLVQLNADNGNASLADIKRITTRLETAKSTLVDLKTSRSDAADSFITVTGYDVSSVEGADFRKLNGDPVGLTQAALDVHPSVLAIEKEVEALRYQLASLKAGKLPVIGMQAKVSASGNLNSNSPTDRSSSASLLATLKVPLFDGGVNDYQQEQILSRLDDAMLRLDKQRRDLREAARNAARAVEADGDKASALGLRVEAARKVAELSLEQFKDGGRTIFDLLDSQSEYFKAQTDLIEQDYARRKAQITGLQLRGKLVLTLLELAPARPAKDEIASLEPAGKTDTEGASVTPAHPSAKDAPSLPAPADADADAGTEDKASLQGKVAPLPDPVDVTSLKIAPSPGTSDADADVEKAALPPLPEPATVASQKSAAMPPLGNQPESKADAFPARPLPVPTPARPSDVAALPPAADGEAPGASQFPPRPLPLPGSSAAEPLTVGTVPPAGKTEAPLANAFPPKPEPLVQPAAPAPLTAGRLPSPSDATSAGANAFPPPPKPVPTLEMIRAMYKKKAPPAPAPGPQSNLFPAKPTALPPLPAKDVSSLKVAAPASGSGKQD
jgi:adhesin transport system outer membrane protein